MLGIKGATNRDIFSQVVCVNGSQPEKARAILANLGMDKSFLDACKPGSRYWITQSGAITAPILKDPPAKDWSGNVIDLRPSATPAYPDEELVATSPPSQRTKTQFRLYKPTAKQSKKESPSIVLNLPVDHQSDVKLCSFLKWLVSLENSEVVTVEKISSTYWAKKYGRKRSDIQEILSKAVSLDLLIEIADGQYQRTSISGHP
jgi:hypothetical protein